MSIVQHLVPESKALIRQVHDRGTFLWESRAAHLQNNK
jgi:hypothetical protein